MTNCLRHLNRSRNNLPNKRAPDAQRPFHLIISITDRVRNNVPDHGHGLLY